MNNTAVKYCTNLENFFLSCFKSIFKFCTHLKNVEILDDTLLVQLSKKWDYNFTIGPNKQVKQQNKTFGPEIVKHREKPF